MVDINDEMWYTNGTKIDLCIENSPSSQGRVRRAIINTYDELGQLVRVNDPNDPTGGENGTTWLYTYDRGGNMKERIAYQYSTAEQPSNFIQMWINHYDPDWKDKLVDSNGITVDYDANGNPTEYWGWNYTWEKGRQLKKAHYIYGDPVTLEFKYNKSGLRTQKVKKVRDVITETTDYVMSNKTLISMKKGNDTLYFSYDMSGGSPVMVTYNGVRYTYVKNLLGDIVALADANGIIVCEYKYDAWGKPLSVTGTMAQAIGALNPFRYRGYIWDEDMENYYLRSRYYNPSLCRFLQADSHLTINAFAYANNNPVMKVDAEGTEATSVETVDVVIYYHLKENKGKIMGKHYSMSIGDLWISFGGTEGHGILTLEKINEENIDKLPSTRVRFKDLPFEETREAIDDLVQMLEITEEHLEQLRLQPTMSDVSSFLRDNGYTGGQDVRPAFTKDGVEYDYSYYFVYYPCAAPLHHLLINRLKINYAGYVGSMLWGNGKIGKNGSMYRFAENFDKSRIHYGREIAYRRGNYGLWLQTPN